MVVSGRNSVIFYCFTNNETLLMVTYLETYVSGMVRFKSMKILYRLPQENPFSLVFQLEEVCGINVVVHNKIKYRAEYKSYVSRSIQ